MSSTIISADLFCIKYGENNGSLLQMFDLFGKNAGHYSCPVSLLVLCWMQRDGRVISGAAENEIVPLEKNIALYWRLPD